MIPAQKQVLFVRHGQAAHNIKNLVVDGKRGYAIPDPNLTDDGIAQAAEARSKWASFISSAQLVVTSPLKRTVRTTLELTRGSEHVCVIVNPDISERYLGECDTGSNLEEILSEFSEVFPSVKEWHGLKDGEGQLENGWWPSRSNYTCCNICICCICCNARLLERTERFCEWLTQREETRIVVVSHGAYLGGITQRCFGNCDTLLVDWPMQQDVCSRFFSLHLQNEKFPSTRTRRSHRTWTNVCR